MPDDNNSNDFNPPPTFSPDPPSNANKPPSNSETRMPDILQNQEPTSTPPQSNAPRPLPSFSAASISPNENKEESTPKPFEPSHNNPPKPLNLNPEPEKPMKPPMAMHKPATLDHKPKRVSSITVVLLAVIALFGIASASFFFLQNNILKQQINVLQSTEQNRQLPADDAIAFPSPTEALPTESANNTPSSTTTNTDNLSAFSDLSKVIDIARQESSTAQLLMITSDDITQENSNVYQYWFRTGPDSGSYFYINYTRDEDKTQLYTQATISPDNNIPDLIPMFESGQIGISDTDAQLLAWEQTVSPTKGESIVPTSIKAKFIRARPSDPSITQPVNLWQLTYSFPNQGNIVVQIDAQTQKVVFSSL